MADVSQILWAAQGITEPNRGLRTTPSARATYPLSAYLLVGKVNGLSVGMYKYQPQGHKISKVTNEDKKAELFTAVGQFPIKGAPIIVCLTGLSDRAANSRSLYLEGGHAAQNLLLQAQSMKLGALVMGGFKEEAVRKVLGIPESEQPIYIISVGKR
jgi:SagB-type dehydrogenase family enzyme